MQADNEKDRNKVFLNYAKFIHEVMETRRAENGEPPGIGAAFVCPDDGGKPKRIWVSDEAATTILDESWGV